MVEKKDLRVLLKERRCILEQVLEELIAIVEEVANDLQGGCLFVRDLLNGRAVEGDDLRFGIAKEDG